MTKETKPLTEGQYRDHFARPVGGMVVTKPPFVCAVCGQPIERTGVRRSNRNWKHITKEDTR
jgi:hypothetical protein